MYPRYSVYFTLLTVRYLYLGYSWLVLPKVPAYRGYGRTGRTEGTGAGAPRLLSPRSGYCTFTVWGLDHCAVIVKTLQNRPGPTLNTRRATPQSTGQADPSADTSSNQRTHQHAPHIEPPPSSKQHTQQLTPHSGSSARGPSTHPKS